MIYFFFCLNCASKIVFLASIFDFFCNMQSSKNNTDKRLPVKILKNVLLCNETVADSQCCNANHDIQPFGRGGLGGQGLSAVVWKSAGIVGEAVNTYWSFPQRNFFFAQSLEYQLPSADCQPQNIHLQNPIIGEKERNEKLIRPGHWSL